MELFNEYPSCILKRSGRNVATIVRAHFSLPLKQICNYTKIAEFVL